MKKIIMLVAVFVFMSINVFANCTPTQGKIIYGPGETVPVEINYQTGVGYCTPSVNTGGVIVDLSKCDNVNDLVPGSNYVLMLSMKTEGFTFLNPAAAATETEIAVKAFSSMDNLCAGTNANDITLTAMFNDDGSRIISNASNQFILVAHPYLLVTIPSFVYDNTEVDGSDPVIEIDIIDANVICITCNAAICSSIFDLGSMSCDDTYSLLFPYGVCNDTEWWTGIALTNLTNHSGIANITVYIGGKQINIAKTIKGNFIYSFSVDEILEDIDVVGNTCYIEVKSNFNMDGVCIYGNSLGQSAYKARK